MFGGTRRLRRWRLSTPEQQNCTLLLCALRSARRPLAPIPRPTYTRTLRARSNIERSSSVSWALFWGVRAAPPRAKTTCETSLPSLAAICAPSALSLDTSASLCSAWLQWTYATTPARAEADESMVYGIALLCAAGAPPPLRARCQQLSFETTAWCTVSGPLPSSGPGAWMGMEMIPAWMRMQA